MDDKQSITSEINMAFDTQKALFDIMAQISFTIDDNLLGLLHPSEVIKVALESLRMALINIVEDVEREEVRKDLCIRFILNNPELRKLINPKFMPEVPKDIH